MQKTLWNKLWRLQNLYKITNKEGEVVLFSPNVFQVDLLQDPHNRKIVLKARQLWITTFYALYYLDEVLFTPNYKHHIIAEKHDTAIKVFEKIRFAFENLPNIIHQKFELKTDRANEMSVKYIGSRDYNWSTISVGTSARWTTLQSLHITEFWKVCNQYKRKAREIVTGALNALWNNQQVVIESTAEWNEGYFYEYCKEAQNNNKTLSPLDYSFHFFPRYDEPWYTLDDNTTITADWDRYFDKLHIEHWIELTQGQKRWYIKKAKDNGDDMKREYPTIPQEAFEVATEWAYYETQCNVIRQKERICKVEYDQLLPVYTCRDLWWAWGWDDMVIRRFQVYGQEIRWIDYWEGSWYGLEECIQNQLKAKDYKYGPYQIAPHDIKVKELTSAKSRRQSAYEMWVTFTICPMLSISDRIQATKRILAISWFDEKNCKKWFERLAKYKRKYDERLWMFKDSPEHDSNSHASDAYWYWALMMESLFFGGSDDNTILEPQYNLMGR